MINQSEKKNAVEYSDTEIVFKSVSFVLCFRKFSDFWQVWVAAMIQFTPRTFKLIFKHKWFIFIFKLIHFCILG